MERLATALDRPMPRKIEGTIASVLLQVLKYTYDVHWRRGGVGALVEFPMEFPRLKVLNELLQETRFTRNTKTQHSFHTSATRSNCLKGRNGNPTIKMHVKTFLEI